jgi:hypothetical protein
MTTHRVVFAPAAETQLVALCRSIAETASPETAAALLRGARVIAGFRRTSCRCHNKDCKGISPGDQEARRVIVAAFDAVQIEK